MKFLKKVSSTLDTAVGKIFDSITTLSNTDKQQNAPSINLMENYVKPNDIHFPTYIDSATDISAIEKTYFFKQGNMVTIVLNVHYDIVTKDSYPVIFYMPEGYRSTYRVYSVCTRKGWNTYNMFYYDPNNNSISVHITDTASTVNLCGILTYYTTE